MTLFPAAKQRLQDRNEAEIRARVAGEIAAAIEARAPVPAERCDPRWCHCHSRNAQAVADADEARRIGGAV